MWKDGLRYIHGGEVQRYFCRSCGLRFSESIASSQVDFNVVRQVLKEPDPRKNLPKTNILQSDLSTQPSFQNLSFQSSEDVGSHCSSNVTITEKGLNRFRDYNRDRLVCVSEVEAKNLAKVESQTKKRAAGATKSTAEVKGKIVEFLWYLSKENRSERTIFSYKKYLELLMKYGADLENPESIKGVVAKQKTWSENTKRMASAVYKGFANFVGFHFECPKFNVKRKLPFIPLEAEIDALIAGSSTRLAALLQLLKEVPIRIGEALRLEWVDIDFERNACYVNRTEKDGTPRALKISNKLQSMLKALPKKNKRLFGKATYKGMNNQLNTTRKRLAIKLQNPRLDRIHFHTLRHWKATIEYQKTRDILHVMKLLGHRNVESTLVYTQLIGFESDEYYSAVAETVDEARKLLEDGFEYVCQKDDIMLFRKRK